MILNIFLYIFLTLVLLIFLIWLLVNIYFHSANIEVFNLKKLKQKKVLAIFAHPDDEAMSCSGTLSQLSDISADTRVIVLTKGERGQEGMKLNMKLKDIRKNELRNSLKIIDVENFEQFDLGDNRLKDRTGVVRDLITKEITRFSPDLIITHDRSGLYGHPDHITISNVVTDLQQLYKYTIWYATFSKKILESLKMKSKAGIKTDPKVSVPNVRTFTLLEVIKKIKVVHGYKSQRLSFTKVFPFRFIPLWFYITLTSFEYFIEKTK